MHIHGLPSTYMNIVCVYVCLIIKFIQIIPTFKKIIHRLNINFTICFLDSYLFP